MSFQRLMQNLESRRLFSAGDLDVSFSGDGTNVVDLPGSSNEIANATVVQSDGKIVLAGRATVGAETNFFVARLLANGGIDTTFGGGDGFITIDFAVNDEAQDLAIEESGKIVVVGTSSTGAGSNARDFAVARLNANGTLDTTFSGDGKTTVDFGANDDAMAVVLDFTTIYVGGYKDLGATGHFALAKLLPSGAPDTSYSTDGEVFFGFGGNNDSRCYEIAIDDDNRIVMVGYDEVIGGGTGRDFAYARIGTNAVTDPSFSGDGLAVTNFSGDDEARAVAIDPLGRIVVGGFSDGSGGDDFVATRLSSAGALDSTFNGDGAFRHNIGGVEAVKDLAVHPDGTITLAGATSTGSFQAALVQITASNGQLNTAFGDGGDGVQTINFGAIDDGFAVALDPRDNRLVLAGTDGGGRLAVGRVHDVIDQSLPPGNDVFEAIAPYDGNTLIALNFDNVRRMHGDGSLDTTFAGDGTYNIFGDPFAVDFAVDSLRRIVVLIDNNNSSAEVRRLLPNGTLDTSFSGDGIAPVNFNPSPGADDYNAIAVDPQNRVVVVGDTDGYNIANSPDFAVVRLTAAGAMDSTFSGDGLVVVDMSTLSLGDGQDSALDVAVQSDGKIVAVGYGDVGIASNPTSDFTILRLNTDGSKDTSFNLGERRIDVDTNDVGDSVALDSSGRIIIGGYTNTPGFVGGIQDAIIMRLLSNGDLDTSFAGDGIGRSSTGRSDQISDVQVQSDGKIVAFGSVEIGVENYQSVRRILSNGTGDPTFHGDGFLVFPGNSGDPAGCVADGAVYVSAGVSLRRLNFDPVVVHSAFLFETAPQRLRVFFNDDVGDSLTDFDLLIRNTTTNVLLNVGTYPLASYDHATNTATFNFNGILTDGNYTVTFSNTGITNRQGMNLAGDRVKDFFFLRGDANHDGRVNLADFNIVTANYGQSPRTYSQGDFNYDGQVNLTDYNILAGKFGTALAATASGGSGNVFASGKVIQQRRTLDELPELA